MLYMAATLSDFRLAFANSGSSTIIVPWAGVRVTVLLGFGTGLVFGLGLETAFGLALGGTLGFGLGLGTAALGRALGLGFEEGLACTATGGAEVAAERATSGDDIFVESVLQKSTGGVPRSRAIHASSTHGWVRLKPMPPSPALSNSMPETCYTPSVP